MEITDIKGTVKLNNGVEMPYFGLGTWKSYGDEVKNSVIDAIKCGYKLIDTATLYQNEKEIGSAIKESGIKREDIFITSKVWNDFLGYESTLKAYDKSCKLLGTDYLDLYLIHWPVSGKYLESWKALEKIYNEGRVKAIGISNFLKVHLDKLLVEAEIIPAINQMEYHPYLIQQSLIDYCHAKGILYQAWGPLIFGKAFEEPVLKEIGKKYNKNEAQIILRWDLQKGILTIPKSTKFERIKSNSEIFDFQLSDEDMKKIDSLDRNERIGYDPMLV